MSDSSLRLGTRGSQLALYQAHYVQRLLAAAGGALSLDVANPGSLALTPSDPGSLTLASAPPGTLALTAVVPCYEE